MISGDLFVDKTLIPIVIFTMKSFLCTTFVKNFNPIKDFKVSILIYIIVFYILLSISLYLLFPKAGVAAVKGLIPGVNFVEWCKIIGRKPVYALWLLFPVVNIFIFCGMAVDMARSFGRMGLEHSALSVIYAPIMFFIIARDDRAVYNGPVVKNEKEYKEKMAEALRTKNDYEYKKLMANNPYKRGVVHEWIESIVFAVFAAAFIRMFLIEAYVIPTGSMEGSLLVGDYLFVSKVSYGVRTPQTVLQVPLLHNRINPFNRESYLSKPSLPYARWFKFSDVQRNDPVVFNYPEGDSVYVIPGRTYSIYDVRRNPNLRAAGVERQFPLTIRPMDKADHYIKRAVGLPGETLEIKDGQIYINDKPIENSKYVQFAYKISSQTTPVHPKRLEEIGVNIVDADITNQTFALNREQVEKIRSWGEDITVIPIINTPIPSYLFPHDPAINGSWTVDNYGPIYIPKKGETVKLTPENIALFERIIDVYENNEYRREGDKFIINGQDAAEYTFKQDYYWMMGDNRHFSEDARMWGYTPEENIVGKPVFIFFSTKYGNMSNGINWGRIFNSAYKMD